MRTWAGSDGRCSGPGLNGRLDLGDSGRDRDHDWLECGRVRCAAQLETLRHLHLPGASHQARTGAIGGLDLGDGPAGQPGQADEQHQQQASGHGLTAFLPHRGVLPGMMFTPGNVLFTQITESKHSAGSRPSSLSPTLRVWIHSHNFLPLAPPARPPALGCPLAPGASEPPTSA